MKAEQNALIFSTVWPEPTSSAAGVRQMQWIDLFCERFDRVFLVSPSRPKSETDWGYAALPDRVETLALPMNDWTVCDLLREKNPALVMFDRFILEEQFGAMVYEALPDALCVLETQDLHLVRRAREQHREEWLLWSEVPEGFYRTETALRETAAIERVDFSFVVSAFEEALLQKEFGIGPDRQEWIPFAFDPPVVQDALLARDSRRDFVWIGNFRHAPNADALRWIRQEIWPRIRAKIPDAKFHVYGAYPSREFMDWNRTKNSGILVHGQAENLDSVFFRARVNLAPLRFGAGVKGKILEGFRRGVPVVTTPVGAEGLLPEGTGEFLFPGECARDPEGIAGAAVRLYQDEDSWSRAQRAAMVLMERVYSAETVRARMHVRLDELFRQKSVKTLPLWRSQMMRHELLNSRRYFSKWIGEKERKK